MPNHCQCKLVLTSSAATAITAAREAAIGGKLFSHLAPDVGSRTFYMEVIEPISDSTLVVQFDSAWSPPIDALEAAPRAFDIELVYAEFGMCYAGQYTRCGTAPSAQVEIDMDTVPGYAPDTEAADPREDSVVYEALAVAADNAGAALLAEWFRDESVALYTF